MTPDPEKIQAIQNWPEPRSLSSLREFLGLAGFYRKFIKNFATLATPLTDLLRSNKFTWNTAASQAFTNLKTEIAKTPKLHLPDFHHPFQIETDASSLAIGAVLQQAGKPLAFFSKRLCSRMQQAPAYVRELFAVTESGRSNVVADALSRQFTNEDADSKPDSGSLLFAITSPVPNLISHRGRLVIPTTAMRHELLAEFHTSPTAGHSGVKATLARLAASFFWPGMYGDTKTYVFRALGNMGCM